MVKIQNMLSIVNLNHIKYNIRLKNALLIEIITGAHATEILCNKISFQLPNLGPYY